MIEMAVALLMFINGEIKEHRIQENMAMCLRGKRVAERDFDPKISYWTVLKNQYMKENPDIITLDNYKEKK